MAAVDTKEFDFGKDHVVLMTDADACVESTYILPEKDPDDHELKGVVQPNGEFNWECPCLGGLPTGPCGSEFREAFSCVQLSKAEPKGMECVDAFRNMQACMSQYPSLYGREDDDDEDLVIDDEDLELTDGSLAQTSNRMPDSPVTSGSTSSDGSSPK